MTLDPRPATVGTTPPPPPILPVPAAAGQPAQPAPPAPDNELSDALRRGAVSYSKLRAVTRVATPETEQALLDVALAGTAAHVEQVVRTWRRVDRAAEQAEEQQRHESRALDTWVDDDGMVVVRGRLTPEVGAVVRRALEAALDAAAPNAGGSAAGGDGHPRSAGAVGAAGDAADAKCSLPTPSSVRVMPTDGPLPR